MSYQVIARKWRPQRFEDLVGQESISRTLRNALKTGRIAHAFLFSGIRGVGKTTVARILAMALNCRQGITGDPCGECESCTEIRNGNSVDVQEIDAASNRGIDSIRELNASVRYGTARDRFRVYIVDEVHMLTNEAFNALLKTLEEPPAHVKFILATTEFHKVPATIASRCQKYEFRPIPFSAILQRLRRIVEAEGVVAGDYALSVVATVAQGSMRDAQSALDKLIAFGGNRIEDGDVRALLGVIDQGVVSELVDAVAARDREGLIRTMHELVAAGVSPQVICGKLIERVRNLLVFKTAGWDQAILQLPDSQRESVETQSGRFSSLDLIRFYDLLNRTQGDLRWHSQPGVHLELTLLKLVELAGLPLLEEFLGSLESGGPTPVSPKVSAPARPASSVRDTQAATASREVRAAIFADPAPVKPRGPAAEVGPVGDEPPAAKAPADSPAIASEPTGDPVRPLQAPAASPAESRPALVPVATDGDDEAEEDLEAAPGRSADPEVRRVLDALRKGFRGIYASLEQASRITWSEGRLRIAFPRDQEIWAQMLERGESRNRLSEAIGKITGSRPEIEVAVDQSRDDAAVQVDPREDPRFKEFLERFPGRVSVRRDG